MRNRVIAVVGIIMVCCLVYVFAQEPNDMPMKPGDMGMMKCPMCHMMMGSMMTKSMGVLPDGGVVVMAMGKLIKFDKDMNVVKEVEIPFDAEAMQKKMEQMMQNCPMCKQLMQGNGMMRMKSMYDNTIEKATPDKGVKY